MNFVLCLQTYELALFTTSTRVDINQINILSVSSVRINTLRPFIFGTDLDFQIACTMSKHYSSKKTRSKLTVKTLSEAKQIKQKSFFLWKMITIIKKEYPANQQYHALPWNVEIRHSSSKIKYDIWSKIPHRYCNHLQDLPMI